MSDTERGPGTDQPLVSGALHFPARTLPDGMCNRRERTGICLSGGGIRSGMFGLGVLQGLQECDGLIFGGIARKADEADKADKADECQEPAHLLSVVSGGSYIAGAFAKAAKAATNNELPPEACERNQHYPLHNAATITSQSTYLTRRLEKYIVPIGFNLALLVSLYVLLAVTVAVATFLVARSPERLTPSQDNLELGALLCATAFLAWMLFVGLGRAKAQIKLLLIVLFLAVLILYHWRPESHVLLVLAVALSSNWLAGYLYSKAKWHWTLAAFPVLIVGSIFLRPTVERYSPPDSPHTLPSVSEVALTSIWALISGLVAALVLAGLSKPTWLGKAAPPLKVAGSWIALWTPRAVGAIVVALVAIWIHISWEWPTLKDWQEWIGSASVKPTSIRGWLGDWLGDYGAASVVLVSVCVAVLGWYIPSSMHREYRRRLMSCYAVTGSDAAPGDIRLSSLQAIAEDAKFPKLIISATGNARVEADATVTGWKTYIPFVLSYDYCGVPTEPSHDMVTKNLESVSLPTRPRRPKEPLLSLFTAIACTGAAISPYLGRKAEVIPSVMRPFIAGGNLRLGRWIPNPFLITSGDVARYRDVASTYPLHPPRSGSVFGGANDELLVDMVGLYGPRMYISDGGHSDNLGLMALLHAGCERIYLVDAGINVDGDIPELRRLLTDAADANLIKIPPDACEFFPIRKGQRDITWYEQTHRTITFTYGRESPYEGTRCTLIVLKLGVKHDPHTANAKRVPNEDRPVKVTQERKWRVLTGAGAFWIMLLAGMGAVALLLVGGSFRAYDFQAYAAYADKELPQIHSILKWLSDLEVHFDGQWRDQWWVWWAVRLALLFLGIFAAQFIPVNSRLRGNFPHHQTFVAVAFAPRIARAYQKLGREVAIRYFTERSKAPLHEVVELAVQHAESHRAT